MRFVIFSLITLSASALSVADSLKDPTRPSSFRSQGNDIAVDQHSAGLSVDAIFVRENGRVAIINGVAVSVGDQQFGAKLIAINADNVIVEQVVDGVIQQTTIDVNSMGEVKKNATNNF